MSSVMQFVLLLCFPVHRRLVSQRVKTPCGCKLCPRRKPSVDIVLIGCFYTDGRDSVHGERVLEGSTVMFLQALLLTEGISEFETNLISLVFSSSSSLLQACGNTF